MRLAIIDGGKHGCICVAIQALAMERVDVRQAMYGLTALEEDACKNAVQLSPHTRLKVLPNHSMNTEGELQGFQFTCSRLDSARVLPMSRKTFSMTSVYECLPDAAPRNNAAAPLNAHIIRVVQDMPRYRELLAEYARGMHTSERPFASFACIPDVQGATRTEMGRISFVTDNNTDQIAWTPSVPAKMGLYHAFARTCTNTTREHKAYVVVSGCLTHAAEELYNLWLDASEHVTCGELLECQELQWLRTATHRNHNRIAADLGRLFGVRLQLVTDTSHPVPETRMALPTTSTYMNDLRAAAQPHEMLLCESAASTDHSTNGIVVDMFSAEGFWLYQGPRDNADYNMYGTIFSSPAENSCFPTKTVAYHSKFAGVPSSTVAVRRDRSAHNTIFGRERAAGLADGENSGEGTFLFPDENYLRVVEELGFNRNDGILSLMPLVCYVHDE